MIDDFGGITMFDADSDPMPVRKDIQDYLLVLNEILISSGMDSKRAVNLGIKASLLYLRYHALPHQSLIDILQQDAEFSDLPAETLAQFITLAKHTNYLTADFEGLSFLINATLDRHEKHLFCYHEGYTDLLLQVVGIDDESKVCVISSGALSLLTAVLYKAKQITYQSSKIYPPLQLYSKLSEDKKLQLVQEGTYKGTTTQEKYFDVVFVMPDYGQKLDMSAYTKWTRIRFKEEHKYYPVVSNRIEFLSISDAMKKSKGLLVVTVPLGILFTEKAKGLRKTLIDNGQLKTIIFLPKDSMNGTSIASAVLVIDVKGGRNSVRFVDVAMAGYTKKQGQAVVLDEVNVLVSKINGDENCTGICYVDNATIAKNHYNLSAKQYPLSNLERSFSAYMAGRPSIKLGQIASFKKAPNFLDSFEKREMWRDPRERKLSFALFEVAPSDINNDFLRLPKKRLLVSETELYRIHKKEFSLRPNDILLITKGASIGRVAFVTDTLTSDCIVEQFVTILRVKPDAVVSAESLFMLLRANIGQKLLSRFALGTSVANLPLTALKDPDVFIPTQKEQLKAQQIIQRNREKERQIITLEAQKLEDYQQLWHLPIAL